MVRDTKDIELHGQADMQTTRLVNNLPRSDSLRPF